MGYWYYLDVVNEAARIFQYTKHAPCQLNHDRLGRPIVGPCWLWTGYIRKNGYGQIKLSGTRRNIGAHVASYLTFVGSIADGMTIDHLCRIRHCANPDHLEQVTPGENQRRGDAWLFNAAKTHCPRGHEYTPENTVIVKVRSGLGRKCRECARLQAAKWNAIYRERRIAAAHKNVSSPHAGAAGNDHTGIRCAAGSSGLSPVFAAFARSRSSRICTACRYSASAVDRSSRLSG